MLAFSTPVALFSANKVCGVPRPERGNGLGEVSHLKNENGRRGVVTMGPWRKGEKDEAFKLQQEILARRRDKKRKEEHFEDIRKRRENIEEYYDKRRLKVKVGEDPLVAWKKLREDGLVDESSYSEMDEGGIPIPMASFGIPKYDNGGRFDLRLPHVEVGYTDEDADVMSKAGNAFKKLFGFGGKKATPDKDTGSDATSESPDLPTQS